MLIHPSICPIVGFVTDITLATFYLCRDSILDLAVDSAELLVEGLLSLIDDAANALIDSGLLSRDTSLVTTSGKDLSVIGGTTTVPGKKLR